MRPSRFDDVFAADAFFRLGGSLQCAGQSEFQVASDEVEQERGDSAVGQSEELCRRRKRLSDLRLIVDQDGRGNVLVQELVIGREQVALVGDRWSRGREHLSVPTGGADKRLAKIGQTDIATFAKDLPAIVQRLELIGHLARAFALAREHQTAGFEAKWNSDRTFSSRRLAQKDDKFRHVIRWSRVKGASLTRFCGANTIMLRRSGATGIPASVSLKYRSRRIGRRHLFQAGVRIDLHVRQVERRTMDVGSEDLDVES